MPRRVQDIVPGNRRTIRDIPVEKVDKAEKNEKKAPEKSEPVKIHRDDRPIAIRRMPITPPPVRRNQKRFPWIAGVIGIVIILAGVAFALSGHFARATFTIVPKSVLVQVNGTYVIPAVATASMPYAYSTVTETGSASTSVPAALGSPVATKAQGTVTVYNAYSPQSQRLVAGTRLADDSGLIYRLTSSIVIPGYTSSGGGIIPGTVSATIVADQPGADYNISRSDPLSDFKIVAYKGTPKYSSFYARLSSDVTDGFSGLRTTVAAGLLASTTADLQASLAASLSSKAGRSVPNGYITYPQAYAQSFAAPSIVSTGTNSALVTVTGTVYGIILKTSDLAAMLAGASSTSTFGSSAYDAPGLGSLSFSILNPVDFSPAKGSSLVAKISGSFKLVGSIPVDTLKKAFAGVSLAETDAIIKKYASAIDINDSFGEIAPPWVSTVPSDPSRITVNVQKP